MVDLLDSLFIGLVVIAVPAIMIGLVVLIIYAIYREVRSRR
jgi:hypothetical protein